MNRHPVQQICSLDGCERYRRTRGLCDAHYRRMAAGRPLNDPLPSQPKPATKWGAWKTLKRSGYVYRDRWHMGRIERQMQHRFVIEQSIGRELEPHETVHHVNGFRDDNRLENLELWSQFQPSGQRVSDKVHWAKQILALYEPEALSGDISTLAITEKDKRR